MGGIGESKHMRKFTISGLLLGATLLSGMAGADVVIDNQTIPGLDIQAIVVSPTSGDIFITTKEGYTVQKSGGEPPPPGSVAITSFSITPTSLTEGGVISINWNTSNAVSCTPTGGTAAWRSTTIALPSGVRNLTMSVSGDYVFALTCNGSQTGDTANRSVSVVVNPITPTSCPSTPLAGSVTEWKNFWLVDFPLPTYQNKYWTIPRFGYAALRFSTGSIVDNGSFTSVETTIAQGVRTGTISECPGDYSAAVPAACRKIWGLSGGLRWATDGRSGACALKPDTTYYFNLTYTDGTNNAVSSCTKTPCTTELQHSNPN